MTTPNRGGTAEAPDVDCERYQAALCVPDLQATIAVGDADALFEYHRTQGVSTSNRATASTASATTASATSTATA